jgi:hypothetical protein
MSTTQNRGKNRMHGLWALLPLVLLTACDLEQEVDLKLPEYEPQIVVECYLQPGQPYAVSLLRSVSYFDPVQVNYVKGAEVTIIHNGRTERLQLIGFPLSLAGPGLEVQSPVFGDSLFFYFSAQLVPAEYDTDFRLEITGPDGEKLTAVTRILRPVRIDTLEYKFNDDSLAFLLTKFQDNPDEKNWYRRVLQEGSIDNDPQQDFNINDEISNGQQITFGTAFDYEKGDTLIATIYHITEDYYLFRETIEAAFTANLSPFGQPARIASNIEGGIGIFTGLSFDRREVIIR